jgi:DNA replication protein DnaC
MLIEQTLEKLYRMKLYGMHASIKEKLSRPEHADLSVTDLLGMVVDDEWIYRDNKNLTRRVTNAKFKEKQACIENINYAQSRGIKKTQVLELGQNHWVTEHQNVILTGPSGSGKSYLAQALGHNACRNGHSVHYIRIPLLFENIIAARAKGSLHEFIKKLSKNNILIIDDFGISSIDEQSKADLLEVVEDRYATSSTILTSQLPISDWHPYLGGGILADAILDRLLHNAHKISLKAIDSLREEYSKIKLTHTGQHGK